MALAFEFGTCTKIIFGKGSVDKALKSARPLNFVKTKALVVCVAPERASRILKQLTAEKIPYVTFNVVGEPTTEDVESAVAIARKEQVDFVVSIGGGSVIDMGKAVAMLLANGGDPLDYMEVIGKGLPVKKPGVPHIAIPTTAGTGAEVTKNAVIKSEKHKQKASLRSEFMYPSIAVVDPELCVSVPPAVTGATGMDAFTQCLEPLTSCVANALTDAIALEGLRHGSLALRQAYLSGTDLTARSHMSLCSLFGGLALANAKLGSVHGFAGVLGGVLPNAPHGAICGALLPACTAVNIQALKKREPQNPALAKYHLAAQVVLGRSNAVASDLAVWIAETCAILRVPPLSDYGLRKDQYPEIIKASLGSSSMKGNPIVLTEEECAQILTAASTPGLLPRSLL